MARPVLPWRSPLIVLPMDEVEVWIRRLPFYDVPAKATWARTGLTFTVRVPTGDTGPDQVVEVPLCQVHTWKHQLKLDEEAQFPRS